jgi:hypothetical protein
MHPIPAAGHFRFDVLATPLADWLRETTSRLRQIAYEHAVRTIRAGVLLAEVKDKLKGRTFRKWVANELPWSRGHAYRLIAVGRAFGRFLREDLAEQFDRTALYLLSRPEVPPEAREYAVELSADRHVGLAEAREILDAHRPVADLPPKALRNYEGRVREVLVPAAGGPGPPAGPWPALEQLVRQSSMVHLTAISEEDDEPLYSVTRHAEGDRPRNAVRRSLADAVLAVAGAEPEKVCPVCRESKAVSLYSDNADLPGGRNRVCRACERLRQAEIKRKRKKGRKR